MHRRLIERGPELLVVVGLVLIGLGVGFDREWLVGFGVVTLMLGVLLPRVRGPLEAGLSGVKSELIDPDELLSRVRERGKDLPRAAVERAEAYVASSDRSAYDAFARAYDAYTKDVDYDAWIRRVLDMAAEGILLETARKEWRVTFVGPLSEDARRALDEADDMVLVSGHTVAGVESHSVIVNAATATEAVNRVRSALEGTGNYYRWEAKEFPGGGFFGPRRDVEDEDDDEDE